MSLPVPWPKPNLPPFTIDLDRFFLQLQSLIGEMRVRRNIPALNPNGQVLVGQEHLSEHYDSPSLTIVPTGATFEPARKLEENFDPKMLEGQWLEFEAHCWGYDDPERRSQIYSFSTAIEVWRELYWASVMLQGGVPNVRPQSAKWAQLTDVNRDGRMLVVTYAMRTWLIEDLPLFVPLKTSTTPGVVFQVEPTLTDPASTETEAIFTIP